MFQIQARADVACSVEGMLEEVFSYFSIIIRPSKNIYVTNIYEPLVF